MKKLYRHFDAGGVLLYVGLTRCPMCRLGQHDCESPWAEDIATITIEHFAEGVAQMVERKAIVEECPLYNRFGQDFDDYLSFRSDHQRRKALRIYNTRAKPLRMARAEISKIHGSEVTTQQLWHTFGKRIPTATY